MTVRRQSIRASLLVLASDGAGFACSLTRNMILARQLARADFGVAATFAMIVSLFEFSARMGVAQCIIRDRDGDDPDFIGAAHLVHFAVAAGGALVTLMAARPLAAVFGLDHQVWAVASLALVGVLRGCEHMDIRRFERRLRLGPSSLTELVSQVAVTAAAWPVAVWFGDYRAALVLLLAKSAIVCAGTHWFAEDRYQWRLRRDYLIRLLDFGWPLVLNGLLMFAVMQGEQFAIAVLYPMAEFAPYAAASTLALMPIYFLGRVLSSVLLPLLASAQKSDRDFRRRYRQVLAAMAFLAATSSVGLILGGEVVMRVVYGTKYAGAGIVLAALAVPAGMRTVRTATALAALARGDSRNELYTNGARLVGLLPALALALGRAPVWQVAYSGVVGEALALVVSMARLRRRDQVPLSDTLLPLTLVIAPMLLATLGVSAGVHEAHVVMNIAVALLGAVLSGVLVGWALPELRLEAEAFRLRVAATGLSSSAAFLRRGLFSGTDRSR